MRSQTKKPSLDNLIQAAADLLGDLDRDCFDVLEIFRDEVPLFEAAGQVSSFRSVQFGRARRELRRTVRRLVTAVRLGRLSPESATSEFVAAYEVAATRAYEVGVAKAIGGTLSPPGSLLPEVMTAAEIAAVQREIEIQGSYFVRFMRDVRADAVRYSHGVTARAELYVARLSHLKTKGWSDRLSGRGVLWWWRLSAGDICEDCISLNMMSPFEREPPAYPAGGATVCGANCKCVLIRTTGPLREAWKRHATDRMILEARFSRLAGQEDLTKSALALQSALAIGMDPHEFAHRLYGESDWSRHSLHSSTICACS